MEVSPEKWRESSIHSIKLAQTIIGKADYAVQDSRVADPLPLLRDACVRESNDRIRSYMRATRSVVVKLQRSRAATNEEIKALNRSREDLEKALDHKRKDLSLNQQSIDLRQLRPQREREEDYADKLLVAEKAHLLSLKRALESQLRKVKEQLQHLNKVRARLSAAIQERSRVTDLLCQSMSSANSGLPTLRTWSSNRRSATTNMPAPQLAQRGSLNSSRSSGSLSARSKSLSAPVPLTFGGSDMRVSVEGTRESQRSGRRRLLGEGPATDTTAPYSALSPEVLDSMTQASEAIGTSREIRQQLHTAIDHTQRMQAAAHSSVNEGLTRKLAQTVTLTQHLQVSAGETKLAVQKGQRHCNAQETAQGYILGPVSSVDLTTRERLDRPIVRVYQRHAGTDLPEAAHLLQASDMYNDSLDTTKRNLALLKLVGKRLTDDIQDKQSASKVDASIVRLRRRKADHRWVLDGSAWRCKPSTAPPSLQPSTH